MRYDTPPSKEEAKYYQNLASEERSIDNPYNFMSPKYSLSGVDVQNWAKNLGIFLAPVALIYLVSVIAAINNSGISLSSFVPDSIVVGSMVLYVLNAGVDILRKFSAGQ